MLRVILALIVVTLSVLWFLRRAPGEGTKAGEATAVSKENVPLAAAPASAVPTPRKEALLGARKPLAAPASAGFSEPCLKFWNDLRGMNLNQKDTALPVPTGCAEQLPPQLQRWHEAYRQSCGAARTPECDQTLIGYRAAATEELTRNTPLGDIRDRDVLADKMLARLQGKAAGVADVADRMLDLDPSSKEAAQAASMLRVQDAKSAAVGKPDDPAWKKVDETLERASRTMGSDSRAVLESRLFAENMRYLDPDRLRDSASDVSRTHPTLGVGPYHQAWAELQDGNRARAIELLEEAVRREPNDPRFRGTLDQLRSSATSQPFQVDMSFQFAPG